MVLVVSGDFIEQCKVCWWTLFSPVCSSHLGEGRWRQILESCLARLFSFIRSLQLSPVIIVSCIGVVWLPTLPGMVAQQRESQRRGATNWGISTLSLPPRHLLWLLPLLPAPLAPPPHLSPGQGSPTSQVPQLLALAKRPCLALPPAKESKSFLFCSGLLPSPSLLLAGYQTLSLYQTPSA